jgi:hypothetical protein
MPDSSSCRRYPQPSRKIGSRIAPRSYAGACIIRLERRSANAQPVVMWLTTLLPQRWGERENARRLPSKGEAWQAAKSIKISGAWSVVEADES